MITDLNLIDTVNSQVNINLTVSPHCPDIFPCIMDPREEMLC